MSKQHKDGSTIAHKWEAAGLGVGPYKFIGMHEKAISRGDGTTQAAGSCQYCGMGIRYCYYVQAANGQKFYVGSDCINALGDTKLVAVVMSEERKRKNAVAAAKRAEKRQAEAASQAQFVTDHLGQYRDALTKLANLPHPNQYFAGQGKTLAEYYAYFHNAKGLPNYWKMREVLNKANEL